MLDLHGCEVEAPSSPSTPASNNSLGNSDNRPISKPTPDLLMSMVNPSAHIVWSGVKSGLMGIATADFVTKYRGQRS